MSYEGAVLFCAIILLSITTYTIVNDVSLIRQEWRCPIKTTSEATYTTAETSLITGITERSGFEYVYEGSTDEATKEARLQQVIKNQNELQKWYFVVHEQKVGYHEVICPQDAMRVGPGIHFGLGCYGPYFHYYLNIKGGPGHFIMKKAEPLCRYCKCSRQLIDCSLLQLTGYFFLNADILTHFDDVTFAFYNGIHPQYTLIYVDALAPIYCNYKDIIGEHFLNIETKGIAIFRCYQVYDRSEYFKHELENGTWMADEPLDPLPPPILRRCNDKAVTTPTPTTTEVVTEEPEETICYLSDEGVFIIVRLVISFLLLFVSFFVFLIRIAYYMSQNKKKKMIIYSAVIFWLISSVRAQEDSDESRNEDSISIFDLSYLNVFNRYTKNEFYFIAITIAYFVLVQIVDLTHRRSLICFVYSCVICMLISTLY